MSELTTGLRASERGKRIDAWHAFAWGAFLLIVALVAFLGYAKYRALAFQTRDYSYYYQFAARLANPHLSNRFSLNPQGVNFLGFADIDGCGNPHRGIHFEPLKYIDAALYALAPSPLALLFLHICLFYLPILYMVRAMPRRTASQRRFLVLLILCWALCPAGIMGSLCDLRPIVMLGPALFVLVLAICYDRPLWEIVLATNLLPATREEGLIFAICAGAMLWARNRVAGRTWHRGLTAMGVSWLFWAIATCLYYVWADFRWQPHHRPFSTWMSRLLALPLWGWAVLFVATIAFGFTLYRHHGERLRRLIGALSFGPILATLLINLPNMVETIHLRWFYSEILVGRLWSLYTTAILLTPVVLRRMQATSGMRRGSLMILASCLVVFIALNLGSSEGYRNRFAQWLSEARLAHPVWELRKQLDNHHDRVLTGYGAYQAFADFEHVTCYDRLPEWRLPESRGYTTKDRGFPANIAHLARIYRTETRWLILTPDETTELCRQLAAHGVEWDAELVSASRTFRVYRRPSGDQ